MDAKPDARDAIAALQGHEAWAIIRRSTRAGDRQTVGLVGGRRVVVESILDVPLEDGVAEVVEAIDDTGVELADRGGFDIDDEAYAKLVEAIIRDEIGQGEGANLVIGRHYRATLADWGPRT